MISPAHTKKEVTSISLPVPFSQIYPHFNFGFRDSDFMKACNAYPALFHAPAAMAAVHRLMICQRTLGVFEWFFEY
jgi:hypothetical protein